jgi:hypothetical protein
MPWLSKLTHFIKSCLGFFNRRLRIKKTPGFLGGDFLDAFLDQSIAIVRYLVDLLFADIIQMYSGYCADRLLKPFAYPVRCIAGNLVILMAESGDNRSGGPIFFRIEICDGDSSDMPVLIEEEHNEIASQLLNG